MKRHKRIALVAVSILVVIAGLRFLATKLPVKLDGPEWDSIEQCATSQKYLYQSIEWYVEENGKLPDEDFQVMGGWARNRWKCPVSKTGYELNLESYGNPRGVVIANQEHRHPTTFMWWLRGLHPRVQTMGDGTIQLFKGGKIWTMVGSKKALRRRPPLPQPLPPQPKPSP